MAKDKKSKLAFKRENVWSKATEDERKETIAFSETYKEVISKCKTEREIVKDFDARAKANGFKEMYFATYRPGERIMLTHANKNSIFIVVGKKDISEGFNVIASHIDSPRLDLKPMPLIEEQNIAMLKTQYYGGIKKYQWVNIPMSLHGTVLRSDGSSVDVVIGEDENDPLFTIPDVLIHLAKKVQGEKKLLEGIEGENLNLLTATNPVGDEDTSNPVKEMALQILNERYQFSEEDLISSEFEVVPAYKARDVGLDRSMIGGYGHDDRACSYAALQALIDLNEIPERTCVVLLVDKEEIGSYGISGIRSKFFFNSIAKLFELKNPDYKEQELRNCFEKSYAVSGDVGGLVNPMFTQVHDLYNNPVIGCGVILEKYTGSGGKSGASDASAEFVGKIRKIFNDNAVRWQPGVLGKIDEGGGGTVALYLADLGISVIDAGVGVLGMHSPFEVINKSDLFETYKAYKAFLKDA